MSYMLQVYDTYKLKEMQQDIEKELKRREGEETKELEGQTSIDDYIKEV